MRMFSGNNENDTGIQTPDEVLQLISEIESSSLSESAKNVILRSLHRFLAELKEQQRKNLEKKGSKSFEDSYLHYQNTSRSDPTILKFAFGSGTISRGNPCPGCGNANLHRREPLIYYVLDSSPCVERYNVQCDVLGCKNCGSIFHAQVPFFLSPESIVGHFTARTVVAIALRRYVFGIPNLRQERISEIEGEVIPRTTQHDALAEGRERLRVMFDYLVQESADAVSRRIDDRAYPILDELADIKEEIANAERVGKGKDDVRHAIHSTVVISDTAAGKQIVLMDTSRSHQGNVEWELNQKRTLETPILTTSDLSSSAKNVEPFPEANEYGYVPVSNGNKKPNSESQENHRGGCWAHLRMHITDSKDAIPEDQAALLSLIASIFEKDAATIGMSPSERLAFHQDQTAPIVTKFFDDIDRMRRDPRCEPNSSWGKALKYADANIHHFKLFLEKENVSLHTNQVEGTHTFQWRQENNSQHYKTMIGAQIGDTFQSLALTALANNENPLQWISACLEHCEDMARSPSDWMPWNFRGALAEIEKRNLKKDGYRVAKRRKKRVIRCIPKLEGTSTPPELHLLN